MKILKTLLYFLFCGSYSLVKREYFKGCSLLISFLLSFYVLFIAIHSNGIAIVLWLFFSLFLFFFSIIYNFLDVCIDRNIPLQTVFIRNEDEPLYYQAMEAYLRGDLEESIRLFSFMKKRNRRDADLFFLLGKMYYKKGYYKKSKKMLQKYLLFDVGNKWKRQTLSYLQSFGRSIK